MQIQFPRRVQLGFRPWYGLTLRQLFYLAIAGIAAGALVLFGPAGGGGLLVRVLVGIGIISIGVALAFYRKDGLTLEQWVAARIKFLLRPQKRVWTRGGESSHDLNAEILIDQASPVSTPGAVDGEAAGLSHIQLLHPTVEVEATSPAVVLIDMAMLLSLFSFALYLMRGGLGEIQGWFLSQSGH